MLRCAAIGSFIASHKFSFILAIMKIFTFEHTPQLYREIENCKDTASRSHNFFDLASQNSSQSQIIRQFFLRAFLNC